MCECRIRCPGVFVGARVGGNVISACVLETNTDRMMNCALVITAKSAKVEAER